VTKNEFKKQYRASLIEAPAEASHLRIRRVADALEAIGEAQDPATKAALEIFTGALKDIARDLEPSK